MCTPNSHENHDPIVDWKFIFKFQDHDSIVGTYGFDDIICPNVGDHWQSTHVMFGLGYYKVVKISHNPFKQESYVTLSTLIEGP